MLEELFNLVKGVAKDTVIDNPDVPNEKNEAVIAEATNTVASGLRNVVAGGGLQNILSLFGGGGQQQNNQSLLNNPIVNMMVGHFASKLMNKFNLGGEQAGTVANSLIPNVLGNLISKTNDPGNNQFSLDNLLNSITGGQSSQVVQEQQAQGGGLNLKDLLSQFGGDGQSGNGGGLMDIATRFARGAQGQQQKNGAGGLMDLIKGFLR